MRARTSVSRLITGLALITLAACATGGETEGPQPVPVIDAGNVGGVEPPSPAPSPAVSVSEADFLGRSPSALDAQFGPPALTRAEGEGQFRRYDVGPCRIYAVVFPDESGRAIVRSVTTGGRTAADGRPDLASCVVTGS